MVTAEQAHHGINITLHVLILSVFLTCFFFLYISDIEKDTVQSQLKNAIEKQVPIALKNIKDESDKLNISAQIHWDNIDQIATDMPKKYENGDPQLKKHNRNLLNICIGAIIVLFIFLIGTIAYFKLYKKFDIKFKSILIDNLVIFFFIGIIEFLFFKYIALNYVPVKASNLSSSLIDRIKYYVGKELS
jgi:hypothetical protein